SPEDNMAKILPLILSAPEPKPLPSPTATPRSCENALTTLANFCSIVVIKLARVLLLPSYFEHGKATQGFALYQLSRAADSSSGRTGCAYLFFSRHSVTSCSISLTTAFGFSV